MTAGPCPARPRAPCLLASQRGPRREETSATKEPGRATSTRTRAVTPPKKSFAELGVLICSHDKETRTVFSPQNSRIVCATDFPPSRAVWEAVIPCRVS